jgi:hypothetical protein
MPGRDVSGASSRQVNDLKAGNSTPWQRKREAVGPRVALAARTDAMQANAWSSAIAG